ncbi:hypothetical protein UA08_02317 [Talaromyces atroroseus]|uniref:Xylose isomerase-like TIM barrel domain-containing protein n=1 Tax=Talaromyces atroroseus TaxID=1441469 RepID=A0A225AJU9_TALAT|nr:hypothetical protein UA08_02317 [Talaromyces atroroseus]OKL61801.1 hypothetical protein UA08_02317 [Talaromyces atroroseus]
MQKKDMSARNEFGIATLSLGNWREHKLTPRLEAAANAGFKWIELFDECWAAYLEEHGLSGNQRWEPTEDNLRLARKLGELVKSLGMKVACTQPARQVEGIKDPVERRQSLDIVAKRFPFMRAFDTDLVLMCANIRTDSGVTTDPKTAAKDLAELGDMATEFSKADGGPMLRIGYEGLAWATRNNTWSSSWEVVRFANRPNVGLILDAFNILAVEFADPYNPAGHGRIYPTIEQSIEVLTASLASLVATVPGDRIYLFQCGDAELIDPQRLKQQLEENSTMPALLPWSRAHRLFPCEASKGGYMPVELVVAAIVATGYTGPISLEVFNHSLNLPGDDIPITHAQRGIMGLEKLIEIVRTMPRFWHTPASISRETVRTPAFKDFRQS